MRRHLITRAEKSLRMVSQGMNCSPRGLARTETVTLKARMTHFLDSLRENSREFKPFERNIIEDNTLDIIEIAEQGLSEYPSGLDENGLVKIEDNLIESIEILKGAY